MRVLSFTVDGWVDPATAFVALYGDVESSDAGNRDAKNVVWLDSGVYAEQGISVMGRAARTARAAVWPETVTVEGAVLPGSIFNFLRRDLTLHQVPQCDGFPLGWVGWLGYELRAQTMASDLYRPAEPRRHQSGADRLPVRPSRYPDAGFLFLDRAIVFDHARATVTVLALGDEWAGPLLEWRDQVAADLLRISGIDGLATLAMPPITDAATDAAVTWAHTDSEYLNMIRSCQASIAAGDAYQLCLTTEATIDVHPDPLDAYLLLRQLSPTHHGAFFRLGEISLLSASPEQFIAVSPNGEVSTSPIKGTRRRGGTAEEDRRLRRELENSDKERAENLMIVDLMRNDIGRVAEIGSVRVPSLLAVESYAQVHQLVSVVTGRLATGLTGMDAVEACFPAGSMTGAPKRSATEILDGLERRARGVYSGAFGYFGLDGSIDLAMVIRTILLDPVGATIGSGGGITALSVPEEELEEVYLKASALLQVLGGQARGAQEAR